MMSVIRELLYADDCALLTHTEMEMQHLMDSFEAACTALGLTISLKKTVLMYQPTLEKHMSSHRSMSTDKSWQSFQSLHILEVLSIAVTPLMMRWV